MKRWIDRGIDRAIEVVFLATIGAVSSVIVYGCTRQQAQSADAVVIDLTNAVCTAVESTVNNPVVDIVCTVAQGVEQGIGVLENADAGPGMPAAAPTILVVHLHMSKVDAAAFLAAHKGASK